MELLRILCGQDKVIEGTDYRSHLCNTVPESSSRATQFHLHCCKIDIWMMPNEVLCRFIKFLWGVCQVPLASSVSWKAEALGSGLGEDQLYWHL
ncbi:hypothetical protein ABKV19_024129 [Rosa sericea]